MSTYRELSYMVLDLLKANNEDNYYTEEHVIYLLDKARATLLYNKYAKNNMVIPESNYQTICLNMNFIDKVEGLPCFGQILESETIPNTIFDNSKIYTTNYFVSTEITLISPERFKYVGQNKWLNSIIYATVFNNKLYLTSNNAQYKYLENVTYKGIFEDTRKVTELCSTNSKCDYLESTYPIEETLQQALIELVVKEISTGLYKPKDDTNNANDDLSHMATFIARNAKSQLQKQIEE